jgi:hypothetical protein
MSNPNWVKGTSGNPHGRPKKFRALTTLLERAGGAMVEIGDERISGRRLMARQVWEGITTGSVSFPDGKKLVLSPQDWKDFVKWAYGHIDGPPPASMDVTSGGEKITFIVERDDHHKESESIPPTV